MAPEIINDCQKRLDEEFEGQDVHCYTLSFGLDIDPEDKDLYIKMHKEILDGLKEENLPYELESWNDHYKKICTKPRGRKKRACRKLKRNTQTPMENDLEIIRELAVQVANFFSHLCKVNYVHYLDNYNKS